MENTHKDDNKINSELQYNDYLQLGKVLFDDYLRIQKETKNIKREEYETMLELLLQQLAWINSNLYTENTEIRNADRIHTKERIYDVRTKIMQLEKE